MPRWPLSGTCLRFGMELAVEGTLAFPLPQHQRLFAILAAQLCRNGEKCAVERGAIIVGEFDHPGLHDQARQFDQSPRAFAALDLPLALGRYLTIIVHP